MESVTIMLDARTASWFCIFGLGLGIAAELVVPSCSSVFSPQNDPVAFAAFPALLYDLQITGHKVLHSTLG